MNEILVTGTSGLIGNRIFEHLKQKQKFIVRGYSGFGGKSINNDTIKLDLTNNDNVKLVLEKTNPSIIFHCAAKSTIYDFTFNDYLRNIQMTQNLCENVGSDCHFVFMSSYMVIGSSINTHVNTNPGSLYAASKLACEEIIKLNVKLGNLKSYNIIRLCNIVDPLMTKGALYNLVQQYKKNNCIINNCKYPGPIRQYASLDRLINYLDKIYSISNITHNFCPQDAISIHDLITAIKMRYEINDLDVQWTGKDLEPQDEPYMHVNKADSFSGMLDIVNVLKEMHD